MDQYRCHYVYFTKTRGDRDSNCVEFFSHNNPLPYNSSSENIIITAHKLAHALQNPAPQAPFSNIRDSQTVAIEKISDIFSKVADNLNQKVDPPQQLTVTTSSIVANKVLPTMTKPIPSEHPNIIEDDDGKSPPSFQQDFHMSPAVTQIIIPYVTVPPPRVHPAQPPRLYTEGPSSNFRSRGKKNHILNFSLTAQFRQVRESNAVTHQISGVSQEYINLVKGPCRKIW